jgi:hypothetical protein
MKLLDVIYFQAYLFYSSKLKESDPHFTASWGVGAATAFIFTFPVLAIKNLFYCGKIDTIYLFLTALLIIGIVMYYFYRNNYGDEIIRKAPLIHESINHSRLIAIIYFALAIIFMFVSPIVSKYIKEIYCMAK